jgi:hypothetical protein
MRGKVYWSDAERALIVSQAADLQAEDPSLTGLALLRAAMKVLPEDRWRKLIALTQTRWFTTMVAAEHARRAAAARGNEDLKAMKEATAEWKDAHIEALNHTVPTLKAMLEQEEAQVQTVASLLGEAKDWRRWAGELMVRVATSNEKLLEEAVRSRARIITLLEQLLKCVEELKRSPGSQRPGE